MQLRAIRNWIIRRGGWPVAGGAVALALAVVAPALGLARSGPLWTERNIAPVEVPKDAMIWAEIAATLKPAVVNVSTTGTGGRAQGQIERDERFDEFFERFFGDRERFQQRRTPAPRPEARGLGSGFIIHEDGYVVTNNHVIDGASEIRVKLGDGREFTAKAVGRDPKTDVALLKIDGAAKLPVVPLGVSSELRVGEPVMAIGNPFGLEQTVTTGIVSATGRVIGGGPYDDFIQTDASINPGNSGGPLINMRGQAVGINTAIFSRSGGSVGIGFAIPVDLAKPVLTQLADKGRVDRASLGVTIQALTPELAKAFGVSAREGALVSSVAERSPAARAGIKRGDVIVEYEGRKVDQWSQLPRMVAMTPIGKNVSLVVLRDGKRVPINATVARLEDRDALVAAQPTERGALGLSVQPLTPELANQLGIEPRDGLVVRSVQPGSAAARGGLQPEDVIVEVNGTPVRDTEQLKSALGKPAAGGSNVFLVQREGGSMFLAVPSA
jgi:serine protease Do